MGSATGGHHYNFISNLPTNGTRSGAPNRAVYLLRRFEHNPIIVRSHNRLPIPLPFHFARAENTFNHPDFSNPVPSPTR